MIQLGWDPDATEEDWSTMNDLLREGSEKQGRHSDDGSSAVYKAREQFLKRLPIADRARDTTAAYSPVPPPTGNVVASQRLFHSLGVSGSAVLKRQPRWLHGRPENPIDNLRYLDGLGINVFEILKRFSGTTVLLQRQPVIASKITALYKIAQTLKVDDYRLGVHDAVERYPGILSRTRNRYLTMARIGGVLFKSPSDVSFVYLRDLFIQNIERIVAAYLEKRSTGCTASELRTAADAMGDFTTKDLRAYIAGHPDDPVVQTYLRGRPVSAKEAASSPRRGTLPTRRAPRSNGQLEPYGDRGYEEATHAPDFAAFARSLRRMQRLHPDVENGLFTDIAEGLRAQVKYESWFGQEIEDPVERQQTSERVNRELLAKIQAGIAARKRVVAAYAARVLDMHTSSEGELEAGPDKIQNAMLRLTVFVIDFAQRPEPLHQEKYFWTYVQEEMRRTDVKDVPDDPAYNVSAYL